MTEDEFWTLFKGGIARYVLTSGMGENSFLILLEISRWIHKMMPYIMEKENIHGQVSTATTLKWLLESLSIEGIRMTQEERQTHMESLREMLIEENEMTPDLQSAMDVFCGNDLSAFEDFLEEL